VIGQSQEKEERRAGIAPLKKLALRGESMIEMPRILGIGYLWGEREISSAGGWER